MLKTKKTVSDLEPGYPVANELSYVLDKIICEGLCAKSALYLLPESEMEDVCLEFALTLRKDGLAGVVKRLVCKLVFDEELGRHRIAEPDELEYAQDGLVKCWDAAPELVARYQNLF
jgi:hypothetical protein